MNILYINFDAANLQSSPSVTFLVLFAERCFFVWEYTPHARLVVSNRRWLDCLFDNLNLTTRKTTKLHNCGPLWGKSIDHRSITKCQFLKEVFPYHDIIKLTYWSIIYDSDIGIVTIANRRLQGQYHMYPWVWCCKLQEGMATQKYKTTVSSYIMWG